MYSYTNIVSLTVKAGEFLLHDQVRHKVLNSSPWIQFVSNLHIHGRRTS